ncbi:S-layer family protein [Keratinibaculum paraultunense]|uniref:S-layer family protein n=1 Tax=Keratinibaculum paraultunense TaxID=1278232 RepID=A0A4R3KZI5_9FIRM|nr:S-layer homology domain-containing protein [Keratinibaculum paraultunense]QQY79927.1 S-layer homology domain-containing protein [Keratinibaculum paraultunense]TCS91754.1 S-layer family protein [Keratinibaculum paraultunense]
MKKSILTLALVLTLILVPFASFALEPPGYEGGINNENNYKEVIFITGEPIEMEGTFTKNIKERNKKGVREKTYNYNYDLKNLKLGATLKRKVTLTETYEANGKQTTSQKNLDKYSETFKIGNKTYKVDTEDYQWNQGQVVQETGLVEYYAGDWSARKTYKVDKGEEIVAVQTIGNLVGYDSPWSATQTQTIHYIIEGNNKLKEEDAWEGTATVETSYNKTKDYNYVENVPNQISFKGGFMLTEKHDNVLKYSYDLPKLEGTGRNMGQGSMGIDTNPIITRLNIPALRDIRGLDSEKEIMLIASMDGFPLNNQILGPHTSVSRGDFARALANTMDIELPEMEEETNTRRSRRNKKNEEEKPRYIDVPKIHRNYPYIEGVSQRNIMIGVGKGRFEPDRELTKAEATTILIRLLGFQNLAPIGNYSTGFKDDSSIPHWAKDHVYMAKELNIIPKTEYFYPNRAITKEETAQLLVNFINYLQEQLKYDYRENILNN